MLTDEQAQTYLEEAFKQAATFTALREAIKEVYSLGYTAGCKEVYQKKETRHSIFREGFEKGHKSGLEEGYEQGHRQALLEASEQIEALAIQISPHTREAQGRELCGDSGGSS